MSDVINIKDFYNQDSRITIVENAIISIEKRFDQVDRRFEQIERRFEQVDRRFERLEQKIDSQFKWVMGSFGCLALSTISILVTLIVKLH